MLWRMSGRWYATLIVLALLFANNRLYLTEDRTGNWPAGAPVGNLGQPVPPFAAAVWRDGAVVCIDPEMVTSTDRFISIVAYVYRDRSTTLATATMTTEDVAGYSVGGAPADPKAIRDAYTAWLANHPDRYWKNTAARLQGQTVTGRTVRWRALFRLVSNILLAIAFVRSLVWTVPLFDALGRGLSGATMTPAERAAIRRKTALAAGQCPACEYDIRGLPARVCPECAHRWSESEARTIPTK